jgi:hypothetical protein
MSMSSTPWTKRGGGERPDALERRIDAWIGPLRRVSGVVEARRRIEHSAAGHGRIHVSELASLDAEGGDRGELPGKGVHVGHHDISRLGNKLDVGRKR